MSTLANFTSRTDIQDTDQLTGYRTAAAGGDSRWSWSVLKAALQSAFSALFFAKADVDVDGTMAANSDAKVPSQKAVRTYVSQAAGAATSGRSVRNTFTQTAHGFVAEDCVYHNGSAWVKAKADSLATARVIGVVESVTTNTFVLVLAGEIALTGKTPGATYYLSPATAGLLTVTEPVLTNQFKVEVLQAQSATLGYVATKEALSLAYVDLTQDVTGVLPNANGGFPKCNFASTSGPTTSEDASAGYTPGSIWVNTLGGHAFICLSNAIANAVWKQIDHADTAAPTLLYATVALSGNTILFSFDEPVTYGAGGNGGFALTMSGGAVTATYASGAGSTNLTYNLSRQVMAGETGTVAYTQPGNGIEDIAGNDLATIASAAVTNNSSGDNTPPSLSTAIIPAAGTTIQLTFSEAVKIGAGGNGGLALTMSGGAVTATYASGANTATLVYNLSRTVSSGETGTLAYTQPADGIEDIAGNDLASIGSAAITNNSTQGSGPSLVSDINFDAAKYINGNYLSQESPADWATQIDYVTVNKPAADGSVLGGGSQSHARLLANHTTNQRIEGTLKLIGTSYAFVSLGARCQSSANTRYQFQVDGSIFYVLAYVSGTQTILRNGVSLALATGNKIALEVTGIGSATRLRIQKDVGAGWVDIESNIDPGVGNYIDDGTPGVGGSGGSLSTALLDDVKTYNV